MAIGQTDISTMTVRNPLGENNNDVGSLCSPLHGVQPDTINIWSASKPHSLSVPSGAASGSGFHSHGLYRTTSGGLIWAYPVGGAADPYRMGDFRGYNHNAYPPVHATIVSVTEVGTNRVLSAPYKLIVGFDYVIKYTLLNGEIDPADIHPHTVRVKHTAAGGGYGGLVLHHTALDWVQPTEVVSSGVTGKETQLTIANSNSLPKLLYCYHDGDGNYQTTDYDLEDTSFKDSFSTHTLAITLTCTLYWNPTLRILRVAGDITNNIDATLTGFRLRVDYYFKQGANTSATAFAYDYPTIEPEGYTAYNINLSESNAYHGDNDVYATVKLQRPNGSGGWIDVAQNNTMATFNIDMN